MNYWWCRTATDINSKPVLSLGPHWRAMAYYEENGFSNTYGPLDPSRMVLKFDETVDCDVSNFVDVGVPITCDKSSFLAFSDFFEQAKVYKIKIDDKPHYQVCAKNFYEIIDLSNCEYKLTRSGTPYRFKRLALKSYPPEGTHFFGFAQPDSIRWATVVSDDFKDRYERLGLTGLAFDKVDCH